MDRAGNRIGGLPRLAGMRKTWCALLAGTLAAALSACTGDEPEARPDHLRGGSSATPRPQVGSWTPLADLPQARTELSAALLDGVVYVAGGLARGPGGDAFYRYDPEADDWRELAPMPQLRNHAPLAAYDGTVYVVGGYGAVSGPSDSQPLPGYTPTDTLFVYDVVGDTWRVGPPLPERVGAHAVATTEDGMIHVLGGIGPGAFPDVRDDHLAFDTTTGTWSTLPPLPTGREHLGAAYLDGVIYTASGRLGLRGTEFEAYDIATEQWTALPDVPTGRSGVAVVAFQGQIYVFGGEGNRMYDEAERFDPASGAWQEITPMPVARHGLGGVALEDGIMLIGGGPHGGASYSSGTEIWLP